MSEKTFLVEIGTEELPSKNLLNLAKSFAESFTAELDKVGIAHEDIKWFATSRRLALKVTKLSAFPPDIKLEKYDLSTDQTSSSYDKISKREDNWAHDYDTIVDQDERLTASNKGGWPLYYTCIKGEKIEKLLANIVTASLVKLPIQKLMRWGAGNVYFIRPIHTVTMLLDDKVIQATIMGIKSDRVIRGHRFMGEKEFIIDNANQYPQILLERGKIIADYKQRKAKIKADTEEAARKIGGNVDLSDGLLEEITSLVEWPVVLTAKFEDKFLRIPKEVLIHIMKNDQKYFPIYTSEGELSSDFIFVANIESKDPQQVIYGNEKVIHSRLTDAEFFFSIDRKKRLEDHLPLLEKVLFQQKLGTLRDKTNRIQALSGWIAAKIGANVKYAMRAGLLSKCDLMTNMVFEFTDTRGVIGMYYARCDGEEEEVAIALNEQYQPRFSGDKLPSNLVAYAIAIADKMDTLVGIFGINKHPKSNKDPFALRRAASGILRIIIEKNLDLDLQTLTIKTVSLYGNKLTNANVVNDVINFLIGRFRSWYQDKGYSIDTIKAVLARRPTNLVDCDARIRAISYFRTMKEAITLFTTIRRVSNILIKSDETLNDVLCTSAFKEIAEIQLYENFVLMHEKLKSYFSKGRYHEALIELSSLCKSVDDFFKNVMINTDDKDIRINRLTLLSKLRELFLHVADISLLQ